jgi:hypothetical protein
MNSITFRDMPGIFIRMWALYTQSGGYLLPEYLGLKCYCVLLYDDEKILQNR